MVHYRLLVGADYLNIRGERPRGYSGGKSTGGRPWMERVETITVIGAGAMGRTVAYAAARAKYRTLLEDLSGQAMEGALEAIRRTAQEEVAAGRLSPEEAGELLARLEPETAIDRAAGEADWIIEAAPDDLETKVEVYTRIDRAARPACLFAATSSTLSISEIASLTYRAPQVLGMRFPHPIHAAGRLELVQGLETSEATLAAAEQVGRRMSMKIVHVADFPGLIGSRGDLKTGRLGRSTGQR